VDAYKLSEPRRKAPSKRQSQDRPAHNRQPQSSTRQNRRPGGGSHRQRCRGIDESSPGV